MSTKESNGIVDVAFAAMSDGEKQHFVNKVYKHDGIYPQKLKAATVRRSLKRGDRVTVASKACPTEAEDYILARVGKGEVNLINLKDGNRWTDNYPTATTLVLTAEEMDELVGESFVWTVAK